MLKFSEIQLNELLEQSKPVVLYFSSLTCGPCIKLSPIMEELSNEMENINFVSIKAPYDMEPFKTFFVRAVPTMIIFKNNEIVNTITGFKDKNNLSDLFKQYV